MGLALDYCVKYSALDARHLGLNTNVIVEVANVVGFSLVERKQRSTAAAFERRGITAFVRHEMLKRSQKKGTQASLFLSH